jgi:hypothetical protein
MALIRAYRVDAFSAVTAHLFSFNTLVNVCARTVRSRFQTFGASTVTNTAGDCDAFSTVRTGTVVIAASQNAITVG